MGIETTYDVAMDFGGHKFSLGQLVYIKYHKDDRFYPARIVDIENCRKWVPRPGSYQKPSEEYEYTGRYGVEFTETNPTIIDLPYFWSREIFLESA